MKKPIAFGKYTLLERINVGGMAEVFRAKTYGVEGFERLVAVKRILPNIAEDQEFITMFIDEAKIAVQLTHANIGQIFDLGVVEGSYFIAMEHLHGRDSRAIFERCRRASEPMPIAQACFIAMKMCEGLDYAHNKRDAGGREMHLVHRDVSPQNVLVSFEGEVKLIDFGIAKAAGKVGKTQAGILKGKFGYMSPEQVRGLPIDRRSDIFSTGIVLYELLTNERVFVGESDFATLEKVRNVEILPPTTYNRKIPDELERIVLKALAKDVEDRYQNAIDLHDELQAFVYASGEFYARKDLAGWMKKTFAKEFEEENARFEQFSQVSQPRNTTQAPAQTPPPTQSRQPAPRATTPPPAPSRKQAARSVNQDEIPTETNQSLNWDDEELETQIYDSPEEKAAAELAKSTQMGAGAAVAAKGGARKGQGPQDQAPTQISAVPSGMGDVNPASTVMGVPPPPVATLPRPLASGSSVVNGGGKPANGGPPPPVLGPGLPTPPALGPSLGSPSLVGPGDLTAVPPGAVARPPVGLMRPAPQKSKLPIYLAAGGAALVGAIVLVVLLLNKNKTPDKIVGSGSGSLAQKPPTPQSPDRPPETPGKPASPTASQGSQTPPVAPPVELGKGTVQVWTEPSGASIKLDGKLVQQAGGAEAKTPMELPDIKVGTHTIEVELAGYLPLTKEVAVGKDETQKLKLSLDPLTLTATITSMPPGEITLIDQAAGQRQLLGHAPRTAKVDRTKKYDIEVSRRGYDTFTQTIDPGALVQPGQAVFSVTVTLTKSAGPVKVATNPPVQKDPPPQKDPLVQKDPPPQKDPVKDPPPQKDPEPSGIGKLSIGAKPMGCKIFIDGRDTGLATPQRDLEVKAGSHKITLITPDGSYKDSFSVSVKAGESTKVIKDYMDKVGGGD